MEIKYSEDNSVKIAKKHVAIGVIGILVILGFMVFYFTQGRSSGYPDGQLSDTQGETKFERNETMFPYLYQFEDIPYVVGTPSKGITRVEGGYAYVYNGIGLVAAEVSNARTMTAYSTDLYSSLYAIQDQPQVVEVLNQSGYINGYSADYGIYKVELTELGKTIHEFMYFLKADKETIVLVATTESKKAEDFTAARDMLINMINTVAFYQAETTETTESVENVAEEASSSLKKADNMYSDETFIREAVLTAAQDYEKMCLIFSYLNVKVTPEECYVVDKNGKQYNAAFVNPGEYGFVIPDVKEGDDITVCIKSVTLDGTTLTQQEFSDYLREQEGYQEGNLHVEEYDEDEVTSEESTDADISEDLEHVGEVLEGVGADDEVMTKVTKFIEE